MRRDIMPEQSLNDIIFRRNIENNVAANVVTNLTVLGQRFVEIFRPVTRGGRSGRTTPRLSAKGPLSQVKESIRSFNKIKISFRLTQSLLPNEVAGSVRFKI